MGLTDKNVKEYFSSCGYYNVPCDKKGCLPHAIEYVTVRLNLEQVVVRCDIMEVSFLSVEEVRARNPNLIYCLSI